MSVDMTERTINAYLDSLLHGQSQLPSSPRSWLNALRADALERANALSVGTPSSFRSVCAPAEPD